MKKIIISDEKRDSVKKLLAKYKSYKSFSRNKKESYYFTKLIGIKVCPYCNINYSYTVYGYGKNAVIRPDIDHFIPKSEGGPELDIDNLIPCCSQCNRNLKHTKEFSIEQYLHPYKDDFDLIMNFKVLLKDLNYCDEKNLCIKIVPKENILKTDIERANNNCIVFKLEERYQYHKDTVVEILQKIKFYNQYKQTEIENILGKNTTISLYSILFSEKYCNINTTSLGKLKKDVLEQYL